MKTPMLFDASNSSESVADMGNATSYPGEMGSERSDSAASLLNHNEGKRSESEQSEMEVEMERGLIIHYQTLELMHGISWENASVIRHLLRQAYLLGMGNGVERAAELLK